MDFLKNTGEILRFCSMQRTSFGFPEGCSSFFSPCSFLRRSRKNLSIRVRSPCFEPKNAAQRQKSTGICNACALSIDFFSFLPLWQKPKPFSSARRNIKTFSSAYRKKIAAYWAPYAISYDVEESQDEPFSTASQAACVPRKVTFVTLLLSVKALRPIEVRLAGKVMDSRSLQ